VPEAFCTISADMKGVLSGHASVELWQRAAGRDEAVVDAGRLAAPL
jgi:hypothetical protein